MSAPGYRTVTLQAGQRTAIGGWGGQTTINLISANPGASIVRIAIETKLPGEFLKAEPPVEFSVPGGPPVTPGGGSRIFVGECFATLLTDGGASSAVIQIYSTPPWGPSLL